MGPIGDGVRVIQLHPSLRCNLRCAHCYSSSGPEAATALPVEAIERMLAEAAGEEFNAVALSGGEPLLYRDLPRLLETARSLGYLATLTTNALPLNRRRIAEIAPHLSLVAISLDGTPASHDRIRGQAGAFERMRAKLVMLRAAGVPFGFIFTLTLHNLNELAEVARFAVEEGAGLLQVHPLEAAGRAAETALDPPDDLELAYAFLEVARLQELHKDRIAIQYDVADRPLVARDPCRAYAVPAPPPEAIAAVPLGRILSSIVVQADGWIVPVQYGFSPRFAIGRLSDGGSFGDMARQWKRERLPSFLALANATWDAIAPAPAHLPFTNWYAAITGASHAFEHGRGADRQVSA